ASRRPHTSSLRDWSSDVCSSDLHTKHACKRLFGAGINLTHLYQGKIRLLWYLIRDLGLVNKLYRGLALPDAPPEQESVEKLWIRSEERRVGKACRSQSVSWRARV